MLVNLESCGIKSSIIHKLWENIEDHELKKKKITLSLGFLVNQFTALAKDSRQTGSLFVTNSG